MKPLGIKDEENRPFTEAIQDLSACAPCLGRSLHESLRNILPEAWKKAGRNMTNMVLIHADLGAEHPIIDSDSGTVSGIIDWADATFQPD